MPPARFAELPDGPCIAVIFTSQRTSVDSGYGATNDRLSELVARRPGFLGMESVRGDDGFGITVAYFETEEALAGWKADAEHRDAQERGREQWYERYQVRVARVERAYGFRRATSEASPKEKET